MKHKKFTMIVALVLVVALAAGLGIWATGEEKLPTVTYYDGNDGNNARFVFTNTGKGSATDLFANFSNCMPGDSLTQTICVKADSANGAQGAKGTDIAGCFDANGNGAIVNASRSILCAWKKREGMAFDAAARDEALRMKQDLCDSLAAVGKAIQ